ncbi:hypothetical protein ONZ43_g2730 [Nemania bipapillata]|uniref:Uncharacterized protein n=1 Tax=Nemania bipapillata TaxID=110536 RepID=A0ACC2IZH2_9PEZI|nr:hypothetical protein ONZ43_g2730 [Nemania bipapillata]
MSSIKKSYFLPPSWDITPEEVVVGSVITNLDSPNTPLSAASLVAHIDTTVHTQEQPASGAAKNSRQWSIGLFSKFIQIITLDGEISYKSSNTSEMTYDCQIMKTERFQPSLAYIDKAAHDSEVLKYLKMSGLGAKVFMITGVKTAKGITLATSEGQEHGFTGELGVDIPLVQATAGPKGSKSLVQTNTARTTISGPIVFAFQVEKLCLSSKGGAKREKYVSGAMLGVGQRDALGIERDNSDFTEEELAAFDMHTMSGVDEETGEDCNIIFIGSKC